MGQAINNEFAEEIEEVSSACTGAKKEDCADFCELSGYKFSERCYLDCVHSDDCKPIPVKEINDAYSISASDLVTYAGSDYADRLIEKEYMADGDFATAVPTASARSDDGGGEGEGG